MWTGKDRNGKQTLFYLDSTLLTTEFTFGALTDKTKQSKKRLLRRQYITTESRQNGQRKARQGCGKVKIKLEQKDNKNSLKNNRNIVIYRVTSS